jgi:hypothetical protein
LPSYASPWCLTLDFCWFAASTWMHGLEKHGQEKMCHGGCGFG